MQMVSVLTVLVACQPSVVEGDEPAAWTASGTAADSDTEEANDTSEPGEPISDQGFARFLNSTVKELSATYYTDQGWGVSGLPVQPDEVFEWEVDPGFYSFVFVDWEGHRCWQTDEIRLSEGEAEDYEITSLPYRVAEDSERQIHCER